MERVITNLTREEVDVLENNDIEWYPDDLLGETLDVCIDSKSEFERALILLGRKDTK